MRNVGEIAFVRAALVSASPPNKPEPAPPAKAGRFSGGKRCGITDVNLYARPAKRGRAVGRKGARIERACPVQMVRSTGLVTHQP